MSQKKQRRGFKDELWREEGMRLLLSTRFAPPLPGNVVAHLIWASQSNSAAHRHRLINDVLPQISLCLQQSLKMHDNHKNVFMEGLIHLIADSSDGSEKSDFVQIVSVMNSPVSELETLVSQLLDPVEEESTSEEEGEEIVAEDEGGVETEETTNEGEGKSEKETQSSEEGSAGEDQEAKEMGEQEGTSPFEEGGSTVEEKEIVGQKEDKTEEKTEGGEIEEDKSEGGEIEEDKSEGGEIEEDRSEGEETEKEKTEEGEPEKPEEKEKVEETGEAESKVKLVVTEVQKPISTEKREEAKGVSFGALPSPHVKQDKKKDESAFDTFVVTDNRSVNKKGTLRYDTFVLSDSSQEQCGTFVMNTAPKKGTMTKKTLKKGGGDGPSVSGVYRKPQQWESAIVALSQGTWDEACDSDAFRRYKKTRRHLDDVAWGQMQPAVMQTPRNAVQNFGVSGKIEGIGERVEQGRGRVGRKGEKILMQVLHVRLCLAKEGGEEVGLSDRMQMLTAGSLVVTCDSLIHLSVIFSLSRTRTFHFKNIREVKLCSLKSVQSIFSNSLPNSSSPSFISASPPPSASKPSKASSTSSLSLSLGNLPPENAPPPVRSRADTVSLPEPTTEDSSFVFMVTLKDGTNAYFWINNEQEGRQIYRLVDRFCFEEEDKSEESKDNEGENEEDEEDTSKPSITQVERLTNPETSLSMGLEEWKSLLSCGQLLSYGEGDVILPRGEVMEGVYQVCFGSVVVKNGSLSSSSGSSSFLSSLGSIEKSRSVDDVQQQYEQQQQQQHQPVQPLYQDRVRQRKARPNSFCLLDDPPSDQKDKDPAAAALYVYRSRSMTNPSDDPNSSSSSLPAISPPGYTTGSSAEVVHPPKSPPKLLKKIGSKSAVKLKSKKQLPSAGSSPSICATSSPPPSPCTPPSPSPILSSSPPPPFFQDKMKEEILMTYEASDVFGEDSFFHPRPLEGDLVANSATTLLYFPQDSVEKVFTGTTLKKWYFYLISLSAQRIRDTSFTLLKKVLQQKNLRMPPKRSRSFINIITGTSPAFKFSSKTSISIERDCFSATRIWRTDPTVSSKSCPLFLPTYGQLRVVGGKGKGKGGGVLFKGALFGMGCVEFFSFGKGFVCETKKESGIKDMIYLKSKEGEAKFILSDRSGTESVVNFIKKSMKNEQFSVLDDLVLEPEMKGLNKVDWNSLLQNVVIHKEIQKGEYIWKEGDHPSFLFQVRHGTAKVMKKDRPLYPLTPNSTFGELEYLDWKLATSSLLPPSPTSSSPSPFDTVLMPFALNSVVAETNVEINVLPFESLALFLGEGEEGEGGGEGEERRERLQCGFLRYLSYAMMEHLREMEVYARS